jgi:hypothetical protein
MQLSTEEPDGGVTRVVLDRRQDIAGSQAIDLKMNVIAGTKKAVLVDMQKGLLHRIDGPSDARGPRASDQGPRRQNSFVRPDRNGRLTFLLSCAHRSRIPLKIFLGETKAFTC